MIQVTRYEGTDKSAPRKKMQIDSCIVDQLTEARNFVQANIESRDDIAEDSSTAIKVFQYPMRCIREIIANALCHRDYSDRSRMVYVTIFDDRLEVRNPGNWGAIGFSEGLISLLSDLKTQSVHHNISLAKAISSIDMMEMEGSGIETAIKDCRNIDAPGTSSNIP